MTKTVTLKDRAQFGVKTVWQGFVKLLVTKHLPSKK